jgi:hypothetical protein
LLNKKLSSAVNDSEWDAAARIDAAMRKIQWVIGLPQQIIRELGEGGENT